MAQKTWTFTPSPQRNPLTKEQLALLHKWSLGDTMRLHHFQFDEALQQYDIPQFLKAFFADPSVLAELQVLLTVTGRWGPLGAAGHAAAAVQSEAVPCTRVSMEFFDRLYDTGAVRKNGMLVGCVPTDVEGFITNQELGRVLLDADCDGFDVFSGDDRNELLFQIFQTLCLGGALNQYEDSIGPYFELTKSLYKQLVSVGKNQTDGSFVVTSLAFDIKKVDGLHALFPNAGHVQNKFVVVVNPAKRTVAVWYNAWCGD